MIANVYPVFVEGLHFLAMALLLFDTALLGQFRLLFLFADLLLYLLLELCFRAAGQQMLRLSDLTAGF